jgi:2,3-bisphosphoglycerate-independent phosphoglycerate mutase
MIKKQIALIVLDGWGYREDSKDNAIATAHKPNFDEIWDKYPHTTLDASAFAVGLPSGQMGNSEVGHMTIGAGRPLDQDLVRIDKAIESGDFAKNPTFLELFDHIKKNDSTIHLMGLLSPGGVHSHMNHLFAFLKVLKNADIKKVAIHVFTDGRDVPPQSAVGYINELEEKIKEIGIGTIASVEGRLYAMDRDNNWDRLSKVEEVVFKGEGTVCNIDPAIYVENLYKQGIVDEHIEPVLCLDKEGNKHIVEKNDGIFFFNFRADRARMLTHKIIEMRDVMNILFVTMTDYGSDYKSLVAFPPIKIETTLAKELSNAGLTQAHITETEKFAHATYFLDGGIEKPYLGEEYILVPSRKDVLTHDLAPKMKAKEIADKVIEQIQKGTDFIFMNFANADMVGHTANVPAIIEGVEEIDLELGRVLEALHGNGGIACITADHGNAEINIDQVTGERHTSHTTDPVPFILTNTIGTLHEGTLADITPTILKILDIKKPECMTGESLLNNY